MPKASIYQGKSPWARAPERDVDPVKTRRGRPTKEAPFRPILSSNADGKKLRRKVTSSSYGKKAAQKKKFQSENIPTREERELEGATFRPKLSKDKQAIRMRRIATSSGYGKRTAQAKHAAVDLEDQPTFSPAIGISAGSRRMMKLVGSSGYGKVTAEKKRAEPDQEYDFTPDLDGLGGATATRLRKQAPSKKYLQPRERPQTAPGAFQGVPRPERVSMHTLYADRPESDPEDDDESEGLPPFVLDTHIVASAAKIGGLLPKAAPVTPTPLMRRIKAMTPSSGYRGAYNPPQGERVVKEAEPSFKFGSAAEVYAETPEELGAPPRYHEARKLLERANPSGYGPGGKYDPPQGPKPEAKEVDKGFVVAAKTADDLAFGGMPVDALPSPPRNKIKDKVPSSGYGKVSPAVANRPPTRARSPKPMKMGTATTALLPVSMLGTPAERDLACVRSVTAHGAVFEGEQTSILASTAH